METSAAFACGGAVFTEPYNAASAAR